MKLNRTKRLLLIFVSALLCLSVYLLRPVSPDPLYKGKPISYWVNAACSNGTNQGAAQQEMKLIGGQAVPYLIRKLQTPDTFWRRGMIKLRNKLPSDLAQYLTHVQSADTIQWEAANSLEMIGPDAKQAAIPLVKLIREGDYSVAGSAANALCAIGPNARDALPQLTRIFRETNTENHPWSKVDAASAIWKIAAQTNVVLDVFQWSMTLRGPTASQMRFETTGLLCETGPATSAAVARLIKILRDDKEDYFVRANAAIALGRSGVKNNNVLAALEDGLKIPNHMKFDGVKSHCAVALWRLDSHRYANEMAPLVIQYLSEHSGNILDFAAKNHLNIEPAIPALRELQTSDSPKIRRLASDGIEKFDANIKYADQ